MKSVILNMTSLTVILIAEIVPDISDLRIARIIVEMRQLNLLIE